MSRFDRIAGYEREKAELAALIDIFNNREKYEKKGAELPKGIIFYGAAGTGKTLFAEVLANECSLNRINISAADSVVGNGICKQIREAFFEAKSSKVPTMIFFDELDKVLPNAREEYYTDHSKTVLTLLLTLIDGMERTADVVFVATCNDYGALPETIVRPGRIDKKIGIGLPDASSRAAILRMYMGRSPARFELGVGSIVKLTNGFSGAALKTFVNECLLWSDDDNFVSEKLIRAKISEIREEDIPKERSDESYIVDAARNAGSFIVARSYCDCPYVLTTEEGTVSNAFLDAVFGDLCDYDDDDEDCDEDDEDYDENEDYDEEAEDDDGEENEAPRPRSDYSKNDFLAALCAVVAGRVSEELLLNDEYDNLAKNTEIADNILIRMAECG
ncbi:MAG: ATP-binding protein, partial [Clostridia bacterium]|nr:ATP-binding protein [Clostridia bacterium]